MQHRNVRLSSNAAPGGRRGAAGSCACCVLRKFGVAQSNELLRPMVEAAVDAFFDQVPPAALPPTAPPYSSRTPPAAAPPPPPPPPPPPRTAGAREEKAHRGHEVLGSSERQQNELAAKEDRMTQ